MKPEISVDDGLVENILRELENELVEKVYSKDMFDCACASAIINQVSVKEEREKARKDITKAFVVSSWTQRIYFVVRSAIMTILGAILTLGVFWRLGTINVFEDFILGISTYVIFLVLSRLFDTRIVRTSKSILGYLGEHTKLRDFIVKYF